MNTDHLTVETEPVLEDVRFLEDGLYDYNVEQTGVDDGQWLAISPVLCFGAEAHVMGLPRLFVAWQTAWRTPRLRTGPVVTGHAHRGSRLQSRLLLVADTPPQWF